MSIHTHLRSTTCSRESPASMALVALPQPEEREFSFLQGEIRLRHIHIQKLEQEIGPLIAALEAFEWEYKARVGTLQSELRSIRQEIETIESRTARLHARLVADPDGILGEVFTREELQEIGDLFGIEVPASWFTGDDEPGRRERDRTWSFHRESNEDGGEHEWLRNQRRVTHRAEPDAETRSLYRKLARMCHPDLAVDDADRSRRQELMRRINAAWHARDLSALQDIEQDRIATVGWSALRSWAERLVWARRELVRLDDRILGLTARLRSLRANDTFPLWFNSSLGNSVIANRVTTLRIDIANAQHHLDQAREAFRQALRHYASVIA